MTTQAIPDPINLKSWEEAFQYPLPTVRKLSVRLRNDIDDHRNRLRSLVGASYRDLLGTAERIIDMDDRIQKVESSLSSVGQRCNTRLLERADANYTKLELSWSNKDAKEQRMSRAARSRILSAALAVVERLIKRNGDTLQAAKLMVFSRLLYRSLEVDGEDAIALDKQRRRVKSSRSRLLAHVDRVLSQPNQTADATATNLSAFALLASSRLRDVLGHFLAVRTAQLENLSTSPSSTALLQALTVYIGTIQLVQAVFPKRISEGLAALGKTALLADSDITSVTELNLDIYGQWIADDIKHFRPWVQQDIFPGSEARKDVAMFSTASRNTLLATLYQSLEQISDVTEVLNARKQILSAYFGIGSTAEIEGFLEHVQEMSAGFVQRLETLAVDTATLGALQLTSEPAVKPEASIWTLADNDFDLTSGGIKLRQAILHQRQGHDEHFEHAVQPLQDWLHRVEAFSKAVTDMRATRWEAYFEVDIEDGEEEIAKVFQDKLSVDDPAKIEQTLRRSVEETLAKTLDQVKSTLDHGAQPAFLLRVLRSLNIHASFARDAVKVEERSTLPQQDLVEKLHNMLAHSACSRSLSVYEQGLSEAQYIATDLWDGTPKLPMQTLPMTFRFVMSVQNDMVSYKEDVWSNAAVMALKHEVNRHLTRLLLLPIEKKAPAAEEATMNGTEPPLQSLPTEAEGSKESATPTEVLPVIAASDDPAEDTAAALTERQHQHDVQRLYDGLYLSHVFATSLPSTDLQASLDDLATRASLKKSDVQRLEKNALEYWRRTYFLFGLLAPSTGSVVMKI